MASGASLLKSIERKHSFLETSSARIRSTGGSSVAASRGARASLGKIADDGESCNDGDEDEQKTMTASIYGNSAATVVRNSSFGDFGSSIASSLMPRASKVAPLPMVPDEGDATKEDGISGAEMVEQGPVADSTPSQVAPLGGWRKIRVAAKTVGRLAGMNEELRIYGADREAQGETIDPNDPVYVAERQAAIDAKWYIILPDSLLRRAWDFGVLVSLMYIIIIVPVRVCFDVEVDGGAKTFDTVVDAFFILDVCFNFFAAYTTASGDVVVDHKQIIHHYLRGWFFLDLIASIPFNLFESHNSDSSLDPNSQLNRFSKIARLPRFFKLVRLLRLLKLLRAFRFVRIFNQWEQYYVGIDVGVTRMFKIGFFVSMITHLIACFWYFVAWGWTEDGLSPESWVVRHGIQDAPVPTKYLTSMYWAFSTLTTVGYGDIAARTNWERFFSIVCMVLGVSWYAFVVSTISSILSTFDRRNAEVKRKQGLLQSFMKTTNVPWDLRRRILKYFEYVNTVQEGAHEEEMGQVLSLLSAQLRTEVTLHVHRNLIPQIPFFHDKTMQFQAACVAVLTPLRFFPGDYISSRGQHAEEMYFLVSGRAVIVLPDGTRYRSVVQGSYFGEIGCILSEVHRFSIIATGECEVYALSKQHLKEMMNDYPDVASEIRRTARLRIEHLESARSGLSSSKGAESMETSLPGVSYEGVTEEDNDMIDTFDSARKHASGKELTMLERDCSFNSDFEAGLVVEAVSPTSSTRKQRDQDVKEPSSAKCAASDARSVLNDESSAALLEKLLEENSQLRGMMVAMSASIVEMQKSVYMLSQAANDPLASSRKLQMVP